jgi:hypothetical protein
MRAFTNVQQSIYFIFLIKAITEFIILQFPKIKLILIPQYQYSGSSLLGMV